MCLSLSISINTVYHVTGLYLSPRSKLTGNIYDLKRVLNFGHSPLTPLPKIQNGKRNFKIF